MGFSDFLRKHLKCYLKIIKPRFIVVKVITEEGFVKTENMAPKI